jgi:drug/metabolite transporter (DMT)-like permease
VGLKSSSPLVLVAALVAVILWGASSVATKFAVAAISPVLVAALRTILAGAVVFPVALLMHVPLPKTTEHRRGVALVAFAGFIAYPLLFSLGIALTSAIHGAMILALLPAVTGAIAMSWDRLRPSMGWWLGCTIAIVGEAVLTLGRSDLANAEGGVTGDFLVLLSVMIGSLSNVVGARLQQRGFPAAATTIWGVVLATVVLCPVLPWILSGARWSSSPPAWAGVTYLTLGATIFGYGLWYWALGAGGIARVGLLQFFQPVSGVLLAWALLDEQPNGVMTLATVIVLIGVTVASLSTPAKAN